MRNRTHEALGACATLAVCATLDSRVAIAAGAVCASLLGSRLPDADQRNTRIHRRTRLERRNPAAKLAGAVLRLPMTLFARVANHRGATHWLLTGAAVTLVAMAVAGALWAPLALPVAIGIGCGYTAHLLANACTPHGVSLLGPLSARRVHLLPRALRVATGGAGDLLVLVAATLGAAALARLLLLSG